ncbi:hypothetical protein CDL12_20809 [Handroanthus impetiginosus]|uniref:CCT domain-containing protein n=1 Tax=Handroanthus impetiginosus TaxID=429701 RepID=A0A2G9GMU9_9LAMI|nr:hypothetical protein CDL12_20809 [Handroanthus impetiginosus]
MIGHDGSELPYDCSSYIGCPSSTSSYGIYSSTLVPRSINSYSPMNSPATGHFESETSSLGTCDLQVVNLAQHNQLPNSPLASESSVIGSMNKASPYSPEKKKERIQRYRSKRNLRNFNKKIKYECRKSLADRRPRVRGRFVRNDEIEKIPQSRRWDHTCVEEDDDDDWTSFLD